MVSKKYTSDQVDSAMIFGGLLGFIFTAFLGMIFLGMIGAFDSPMLELGIENNDLVEYHVLKYYPEYENCTFEYRDANQVDCEYGISGVEIYCSNVNNRDGMVAINNNPQMTLCLEDITIGEIFNNILDESGIEYASLGADE